MNLQFHRKMCPKFTALGRLKNLGRHTKAMEMCCGIMLMGSLYLGTTLRLYNPQAWIMRSDVNSNCNHTSATSILQRYPLKPQISLQRPPSRAHPVPYYLQKFQISGQQHNFTLESQRQTATSQTHNGSWKKGMHWMILFECL